MTIRLRTTAVLAACLYLAACDAGKSPLHPDGKTPVAPRMDLISYTGFAKPVAGLREYNGTFSGSPGTGTIGYSTLYRDNYSALYGWTGEGSGKHTGVDIPVVSWTSVYAAQGGQIVYARCGTDGFGGRITIKSSHPYIAGRYVYYTYAHLNDWNDRAELSWVNTGDIIGRSGGAATGDVCPGSSTGAHLHFQVDNDNDASYPHGRSVSDTNQPDAAFAVNAHTYSPMVFIQGGYRWEFQGNGNDEYWRAINIAVGGISDGAFWIDGNNDPYLWRSGGNISCELSALCSTQIAAEANLYRYVRLDTYMGGCWNPPMKVYFKTSAENYWDEAKSVEGAFFYGPVGGYQSTFDMSVNPRWTGIVTGVRVDPAVDCSFNNGINYIGYIRLVNSPTG